MAFNVQSWGRISSSSNNAVVTLQDGTYIGAPNLFSYISATDNQATIAAANYFAPVVVEVNVGDFIWAIDSANVPMQYTVTAKNNDAKTITVVNAAPAAGDVIGPAGATDNALVRFDGASGTLIQNGVILESDAGDLSLVNSIQNAVGTAAAPSYTFTGDVITGIYSSAADLIDFSAGGTHAVQIGLSVLSIYGDGVAHGGAINLGNQASDHAVALTAPTALAVNQTYTLPLLAPTVNGQVLASTTAGIMSWQDAQKSIWVASVATPVTMVANTYYLANDAAADVVFNMPALSAVGDMFQVVGMQSTHGWQIKMAAGQTAIRLDGAAGNITTVAGTITWNAGQNENYSSCLLVCSVANTTFIQISGAGNPIFA